MKKYIVFLVILFIGAFFTSGCIKQKEPANDIDAILDRGYLLAGVKTDSAPFGYYDEDNRLAGIDIEIARAIANNIFENESIYNVQFVPVTAANKISKLNTKEVDILVATMSINEKRKLVLDFSIPYFLTSQKLMVRNDSKIRSLTYFNSKGKLVAIIGSTGEKILRLIAPNAYVIGVKSYFEARNLLKNGEADGIFGDDCLLAGLNDGSFKIMNKAYSKENYAVAIRKTEESKKLLDITNRTIAALIDERELDKIKKQYIKENKNQLYTDEEEINAEVNIKMKKEIKNIKNIDENEDQDIYKDSFEDEYKGENEDDNLENQ